MAEQVFMSDEALPVGCAEEPAAGCTQEEEDEHQQNMIAPTKQSPSAISGESNEIALHPQEFQAGESEEMEQMETNESEIDAAHHEDKEHSDNDLVGEPAQSATTPEEEFVFKCVFCDLTLTSKDRPKIMECLHNACGSCMDQKIQEINDSELKKITEIQCQACSFFMRPENIIDNQFLSDTASDDINKYEDVKCSSCSDEAVASSWCVDCSEFICDDCVQAHQRLKITKDHTIKHKDEAVQELASANTGETPLYCRLHPHERLSLFCENCDKLTCRDCQLMEHRDHKYKFTHEIASDCRQALNAMLTDISYKRVLLSSAMKVIDDRQSLINEKKQALVQQITSLVVRLTNAINLRGKQLVGRLNEICDSKHKTLDEKKIALDQLSQVTDHCILFTRNVLDYGSDNALLYSKRHMVKHLQRIKSRRADIPNPEIPVRIDLALEKVPDLIKGLNNGKPSDIISSIGQIIVDGRVYPSLSQSPSNVTPQNSPSPNTLPPHQPPPQQQQHGPPQASMNNSMYMPPQQRMMAPYTMQQYPGTSNQPPMISQVNMQQQMKQHPQNPIQNLSQTVQSLNTAKMPQVPQGAMQGVAMNALSRLSQHQQQQHMQRVQQHMQQQQQQPAGMRQPGMPPSMHARMQTPAMNQQVSSSTHPQTNLRNLLQPSGNNAVYIQTGPNQYQAVQPQYVQHYQNRMPGPYRPSGGGQQPQGPPPQSSPQAAQGPAPGQRYPYPPQRPPPYGQHAPRASLMAGGKWHIPQHGNGADPNLNMQKHIPSAPTLNSNYKIMLKPQNGGNVTSTNPKTPSPNNYLSNDNNTEKSLDKFCEESVNDLMATIAKLDSNGVQVLAENRPKGNSPHVDSSTGDVMGKMKSETAEKDDPNEDWCAVCMDGGELVCCDKCPKVFHQFCHIPNLTVEESDTWQCLLCLNFADIPDSVPPTENDLSPRQRKLAERIVLELYCQYEVSLPFREIIGPENQAYHEIIKRPIALDTIRQKLDWNTAERYKSLDQLVKDIRVMFKNARLFNPIDAQVYSDATNLEKFFDEQLEKWLPEYAYEMFGEDEAIPPPNKKYKRIINE